MAEGLCTNCLARTVFAEQSDVSAEDPTLPESCTKIGDYELLERIGRGGMGIVYRARQASLRREVAVKVLLDSNFASAGELARFRGEAAAAAALHHPNIVAIHEIGEHAGQQFFSMDFVAGQDLAAVTRQGPLGARQAAELVMKIAGAIQHSHERGILHRDLKPSNVLVDAFGEPHVTDFGLAKRIRSASSSDESTRGPDPALTLTGQVIGTPGYMSPEQALARRALGPATDIYSLGALLYHLLTARAPFAGETPTAVLRQVEEQEPVSPRLLNASIPRDLETICLRCLAKEPARRYASARELGEDLGRFLRHEPIRARPTSAIEHTWRWCRRRPALAAALAAIGLLLVIIAAASSFSARRIAGLHREASTNLYAADMRLAQQAVAESKFGIAVDLLEHHRPRPDEADLRGFEWYYLWEQCRSDEVATLGRHPDQAQRAAFSPDGRFSATASGDVNVWDMSERRLAHHFPGSGFVWSLAFSADSRRLAAAFQDLALVCYDPAEGREIGTITNLGIQPLALAWEPGNGQVNVIGSGQSFTWNLGPGTLERRNGVGKGIARLALTPDARTAAAVSVNWILSVWDMRKVCRTGEIPLQPPIRSLAISPDGQRIVTGDYAGNLAVRQISKLKESTPISAHRGMIATVVFSPDGSLLATGGADQIIRLWDTATWAPIKTLRGHRSVVFSIAFSPNGRELISGDKSGEVKLWSLTTNRNEEAVSGSIKAALAEDGSTLAFINTNGFVVIRVPSGASRVIELPATTVLSGWPSAVSTNGVLVSDGLGHPLAIRSDGRQQWDNLPKCAPGSSMLLSPSGQYLVFFGPDEGPRTVWDMVEQRRVCQITNAPRIGSPPAIAADNRHFAVGSANGDVYVTDLRNGRTLARFSAHQGWCYACDFSRDGRRLVTAGFDGLVKLWDADTCRRIAEFRSSADAYWTVALSPDGRRIAAGTGESTIIVWDVASRQEVGSLRAGDSLVPVEGQLRFSPEGDALAFAGANRWNVWRAPKFTENAVGKPH